MHKRHDLSFPLRLAICISRIKFSITRDLSTRPKLDGENQGPKMQVQVLPAEGTIAANKSGEQSACLSSS